MPRRTVYLVLTVIGTIAPYWFFVPWAAENGLDLVAFLDLAFANPVSSMLTADISITAVALIVFALAHLPRLGGARIATLIAGTFLIGVSFSLPLLLYWREGDTA